MKGRDPARLASIAALVALGALGAGCGGDDPQSGDRPAKTEGPTAAPAPSALGAAPVPAPPRPLAAHPNPLGLPARDLDLPAGARIFAVPEPMLHGAKLGSTLVLHAARVVSRDVDALLVQTREGEPYKLHPGYVVPAPAAAKKPGVGDPVIAEWAGVLKHGVVRTLRKGKPVVRFFDASDTADRTLDDSLIIRAEDGFRPGNFAAASGGDELRHVMLVSPVEGESRRWLALGHAGAAMLIEETALVAIPVEWAPKEQAPVLVESLGRMRPGVIQAIDRPGLYSVKLERAGRPSTVGWGFLMPPTRGAR